MNWDYLKTWIAGIFLCAFFLLSDHTMLAQHIEFVLTPGVERAREQFMDRKKNRPYFRGWRVVVGITRDRRELDEMERKFKRTFPDRKSTWVFSDPFFRLLTGAYYSRWDALPTLIEIRREFPGAFEMNADIPYKEFLK